MYIGETAGDLLNLWLVLGGLQDSSRGLIWKTFHHLANLQVLATSKQNFLKLCQNYWGTTALSSCFQCWWDSLFWEKLPSKFPQFKGLKDRVTLLLGRDATKFWKCHTVFKNMKKMSYDQLPVNSFYVKAQNSAYSPVSTSYAPANVLGNSPTNISANKIIPPPILWNSKSSKDAFRSTECTIHSHLFITNLF
jgi:hypothetical protein